MGYDLNSESGADTSFSGAGWALLLRLAEEYGWEPRGTTVPEGEDPARWEGDYDTNDGSGVTREDAAAMAEALTRALADPNHADRQIAISRQFERTFHDMEVEAFGPDESGAYVESADPSIFAADDLRQVIGFLKQGGFTID